MDNALLALLTQIGQALLAPAAVAGGAFLAQQIKLAQLKIRGDTWEQVKLTVATAVQATQQQLSSADGASKKKYCTALTRQLLTSKKLKFDEDLLSIMIESQVWEQVKVPNVPLPPVLPPTRQDTPPDPGAPPVVVG
jgi:hypothetical protein